MPIGRSRKPKPFSLEQGEDGLVVIIRANGRLLTKEFKFIGFDAAQAFLDRYLSDHGKPLHALTRWPHKRRRRVAKS